MVVGRTGEDMCNMKMQEKTEVLSCGKWGADKKET